MALSLLPVLPLRLCLLQKLLCSSGCWSGLHHWEPSRAINCSFAALLQTDPGWAAVWGYFRLLLWHRAALDVAQINNLQHPALCWNSVSSLWDTVGLAPHPALHFHGGKVLAGLSCQVPHWFLISGIVSGLNCAREALPDMSILCLSAGGAMSLVFPLGILSDLCSLTRAALLPQFSVTLIISVNFPVTGCLILFSVRIVLGLEPWDGIPHGILGLGLFWPGWCAPTPGE